MSTNKSIATRFTDRPEVSEIFADSINEMLFDGQTMRIEFCVTRLDKPAPGQPGTACRQPSCRMVLTPAAMLDLFKRISQIVSALEKNGVIKHVNNQQKIIQ